MARAALPKLFAKDDWLLMGKGPAEAARTGRAALVGQDSSAPVYEVDPMDDDSEAASAADEDRDVEDDNEEI